LAEEDRRVTPEADPGEEEKNTEDDVSEDEEDEDDFDRSEIERIRLGQRYKLRTTYPLNVSTGRKYGNVQRQPGIILPVEKDTNDERDTINLLPYHSVKACRILQIYEVSGRAGLADRTKAHIRKLCKLIPKLIAEFASEMEELIALAKSRRRQGYFDVFDLIKEAYEILESWLERLKTHTMQTRYELTFATCLVSADRENIKVPINEESSPLPCLSFVKRSDLHLKMQEIVTFHGHILLDGFYHLKANPDLRKAVPPPVVAAYMASGEITSLLLGLGGGAKGTILHTSLEKAESSEDHTLYDRMAWVTHPSLIQYVDTEDWTCVTEGVDPSICHTRMLQLGPNPGPNPDIDETTNPLAPDLAWLAGKLPSHEIRQLKCLRCPSQFVLVVQNLHKALLEAGSIGENPTSPQMFQRVDPGIVGECRDAVVSVFEKWAHQIVVLYKLEYAERLVQSMKRAADPRARIHGEADKDLVNALYLCNTKSQIEQFYQIYLASYWTSPIKGGRSITTAGKREPKHTDTHINYHTTSHIHNPHILLIILSSRNL
jgi:hypothetical protein